MQPKGEVRSSSFGVPLRSVADKRNRPKSSVKRLSRLVEAPNVLDNFRIEDFAYAESPVSAFRRCTLHVSQTFLSSLIAGGKLPSVRTTREGNLQISRAEVLAYKERIRKAWTDGLEKMMDASQRMALYDGETRELPLRRKQR